MYCRLKISAYLIMWYEFCVRNKGEKFRKKEVLIRVLYLLVNYSYNLVEHPHAEKRRSTLNTLKTSVPVFCSQTRIPFPSSKQTPTTIFRNSCDLT